MLRYYEWSATPQLPEFPIDNKQRIPERTVSPDENNYLNSLRNKEGILYGCLHYYVLEMLGLRQHLPASFVRREYLPVGNPETIFDDGDLPRGQCIAIASSRGIPEGQRLYLTIYNRSIFSVFWSEVRSLPDRTLPVADTGSYLWRLHAMHFRETLQVWRTHLHVVVQSPQSARRATDRPFMAVYI